MLRLDARGWTVAAACGALLAAAISVPRPLQAAKGRPQQAQAADETAVINADEIQFDTAQGVTLLSGNVEVISGRRILRADSMTLRSPEGRNDQIDWAKAK